MQRACFVIKLGTTTKNGRKQHKHCRIFGRLLRRFNMKRGKLDKIKPAALDIVPDTLLVGEFWKGVINSKYIWPSLILLCVTKAGRVGRRAHFRTDLISIVCAYGNGTKMGVAHGHIQPFGQRRFSSYGNSDKMVERPNIPTIILSSL